MFPAYWAKHLVLAQCKVPWSVNTLRNYLSRKLESIISDDTVLILPVTSNQANSNDSLPVPELVDY